MVRFLSFKNRRLAALAATVALTTSPVWAADLLAVRFGETSATATRIVFDLDASPFRDLEKLSKRDLDKLMTALAAIKQRRNG